ncbi:MAG: PEP-utilizing enzyme, partial [Thermodesulfovibrionales bacterium]|nr:PEP-utilizing enzyme [Thermodesulfovibrionales bacterium]
MKKLLKFFIDKQHKDSDPVRHKYRFYRSLLRHNYRALSLMAAIEQLYYSGKPFTLNQIRIAYEDILEAVTGLVYCLQEMTGHEYDDLLNKIEEIDNQLFGKFAPSCIIPVSRFTINLEDVNEGITRLVGSKALNLAIIGNQLGLTIPKGFVITSYAFEKFLEHNKLTRFIDNQLSSIRPDDFEELERVSSKICKRIQEATVPPEITKDILDAFEQLENKTYEGVMVAVRSSAVGEDTEATFAGQYETKLNVKPSDIIDAYKSVVASKYLPRSINYRLLYGLDDKDTPMAVIVVEMIKAKASGVLYTIDPAVRPYCPIKVTSVFGMGEPLVSGMVKPDVFLMDRINPEILEYQIANKDLMLITTSDGGSLIKNVSSDMAEKPSVSKEVLIELREKGLIIEEYYESPQDIEWAIDENNTIFFLQTRPLNVPSMHPDDRVTEEQLGNLKPILKGGETVSIGVSAGKIFVLEDLSGVKDFKEDVILVTKNASPEIARYITKIKGLITDIGSSASHLASVAREFNIPAIFGINNATKILKTGMEITLWADKTSVYEGIVEKLLKNISPSKKLILNSAVHKTLREVIEKISPLYLNDADSEDFIPQKVQTFHDIIRYTHEMSVKEIFGLSSLSPHAVKKAKRLKSNLPINIWILDFSKAASESSDYLLAEDIKSVPFNALWKGFTHPGVNWEGTMNLNTSKLTTLFASTATAELGELPGGDSYAVVSADYLNVSIKFAYHFANIDALCCDVSSQNYVMLQFSGGAGTYYGKSLRVQFLGAVLNRLGFKVNITGDLIEAVFARYDKTSTENAIDLMGRLIASARLLDISISTVDDIEYYVEEFFRGNYDFINMKKQDPLSSFYTKGGTWNVIYNETDRKCIIHDGSIKINKPIKGITSLIGRLFGKHQDDFFQNIELHHNFPLLIVKNIEHKSSCKISARFK